MPDLCMCTGKCPISNYCYRYTAIANPYGQTYSCLEDICIPENYSEFIPDEKRIRKAEKELSLNDFLLEEIHKVMNRN